MNLHIIIIRSTVAWANYFINHFINVDFLQRKGFLDIVHRILIMTFSGVGRINITESIKTLCSVVVVVQTRDIFPHFDGIHVAFLLSPFV